MSEIKFGKTKAKKRKPKSPMKENPKPTGRSSPPPVGRRRRHQKSRRKGIPASVASLPPPGSFFNEKMPLHIFAGGCAKGMLEKYPDAATGAVAKKYPNCTPGWANLPDEGIAAYVGHLLEVQNKTGARQ
jgi:hypothetical protein